MLMVGTLQCRGTYRASEGLYNNFVRSQRGFLDANANVLKAHFMRENGVNRGQAEYDRFGTSLANQYSSRLDDPDYCDTVHHFARLAARASNDELLALADAVAEPPRSGVCRPSNYQHDRPAFDDARDDYVRNEEPLPPPRIVISDPADSPVAPALVQEAKAESEPAPLVAPEAPFATASAEEAVPAPVAPEAKVALIQQVEAEPAVDPTSPSRDDALKAAIVALQSAVVALQAVSASGEPGPVDAVEVPASGTSR
jgi:hypothetical protein